MTARGLICLLLVAALSGPRAWAQCGEPPRESSCDPRVIPGAPGVYEVEMGVANARPDYAMSCTANPGNVVWFQVTPTVTGTLTFTTCHPSTTYDTVIQPWLGTGDCEFPQRLDAFCVDDTSVAECANGCAYYGGIVRQSVTAGWTYLFQVASYNDNSSGCTLCLGVRVTICDFSDTTAPTAVISQPSALSCVCGSPSVIGTASSPIFGRYRLEYASADDGAWSLIAASNSAVVSGPLGTWNTAGLPEGYYILRLIVESACGVTSVAERVVWLDAAMDSLDLRSPAAGSVLGGTVCADGTAWDHCAPGSMSLWYRPSGGSYQLFGSINPPWIVNDPLGSWDSRVVPDGSYEIQLRANDSCGNSLTDAAQVVIDNTPPSAVITSPGQCAPISGTVAIRGTVQDAHLAAWQLSYTGGPAQTWVALASGSGPVNNGVLANWNTTGLPACGYTLRLIASDSAIVNCNGAINNRSESLVSIQIGGANPCPTDIDGDGDIDLQDLAYLLSDFGTHCP